jgi:hypothetical protein
MESGGVGDKEAEQPQGRTDREEIVRWASLVPPTLKLRRGDRCAACLVTFGHLSFGHWPMTCLIPLARDCLCVKTAKR